MKAKHYNPFKLKDLYLRKRYKEAVKKSYEAVDYLYREGANRIFLFGSILKPEKFYEHSDIDIAVEGIDDFSKQLILEAELMGMFDEFDFDLIFLDNRDEIKPYILESIFKEGKLCYRS